MTDAAISPGEVKPGAPKLDSGQGPITRIVFMALLGVGIFYCGWSLKADIGAAGETINIGVFALLGLALPAAIQLAGGLYWLLRAVFVGG
jgi:hypothetical protein